MKKDDLKPLIIDDSHIKMIVRAEKCSICEKLMVEKGNYGVFPSCFEETQEAQIKLNERIVFKSKSETNDGKICIECHDAGKASFKCELCGEVRPTNEIEVSFGDPAEHLCKICYGEVSAKDWDKKVEELENEHQYDFQ